MIEMTRVTVVIVVMMDVSIFVWVVVVVRVMTCVLRSVCVVATLVRTVDTDVANCVQVWVSVVKTGRRVVLVTMAVFVMRAVLVA